MRTRQWHRINVFHRCGVFTIIMCYVMDFVLCNFVNMSRAGEHTCSLVPKPPPFFVVWLAFSIAATLQLP